ncbi:MAG: SprT-like domain-containing protein [Planctomycetota bacterium]
MAPNSPPSPRAAATAAAITRLVRPLLPPPVVGYVGDLVARQPVELRLSRPRRTKLGDHRPPTRATSVHRITINEDLNPYAFLTTLLHEIAHAATWERHRGRRRVKPHGREWKEQFAGILAPVVTAGLLPAGVTAALSRYLENPAAASCSDRGLVLALAEFDAPTVGKVRVEDLDERMVFKAANGAVFRAGRMIRSRRACFELSTGREYRVHGLAFVEPVAEPAPAKPRRRRRAT